jgi:hypothetical protein
VCVCVCVCVFITAGPITKLFACGGGDIGGRVLRETTSRGLCGLVCPSRTVCVYYWDVVCLCYYSTYYKVCVFITAVPIVVSVFITTVPITKLFARGGGGMEGMCYERLRAEAYVN